MSLVVSDASPLHYLVLVGEIEVLPKLFENVVVPEYVWSAELSDPKPPVQVRQWVSARPEWIELASPARRLHLDLDRGDSDAIALALEMKCPVLLDDKPARDAARERGIIVVGTLGVLERAAAQGLLHLDEALVLLRQTNMRINDSLIEAALDREKKRRGRKP